MVLRHSSLRLGAFAALLLPLVLEAEEHLAYTQPAMGTLFRIELYADDKDAAERAVAAAFKRIDDINAIASDYLPESELSRLSREPANQPIAVSEDLFALISKSVAISQQTGGSFDITSAYAIQQWRRAKRQNRLPTPEQTQKAVAMADWRAIQLDAQNRTVTKLKDGLMLDLGGIGKGYAADAALAVLKRHGIIRALVAGSGDLAIGAPPPGQAGWTVALRTFESSDEKNDKLIQLPLSHCGCSTSGDLHQFLELGGARYSHIVNPRTGLGLTGRIACTVIAPDATTSDGLATAMCVLGIGKSLDLARRVPGIHARFATPDGGSIRTETSPDFPAAQ